MGTPNNKDDDLITVGKFLKPTEAQIAKGMLEAAGIPCTLQGENANNMLALAFRSRLRVRRGDVEMAEELLQLSEPDDETAPLDKARYDA